jgi:3-hydroxymyristoyl/3-hydroxydecanoyl-(acyl carrier protein) dehydratase
MKLPEVLSQQRPGPGRLQLQLRLQPELRYFKGHFPGAPVLPGVVQIDWARHYALERLDLKGDFAGMEALKFQQVLQPGNEVELNLEYNAERGRLKFQFVSARGRHSSGVLLFA